MTGRGREVLGEGDINNLQVCVRWGVWGELNRNFGWERVCFEMVKRNEIFFFIRGVGDSGYCSKP